MHDPNPLAAMMHLRELDRQAAPKLIPLRPERRRLPSLAAFGAVIIPLLRFLARRRPARLGWTS